MENKPNIIKVSSSNELMGVEFADGELTFKVPETFREEKDESLNKRNLLLFVKSLNLSDTDTRPEIKKSDEEGGTWPIDSYLWIIRDYLENGYYYNREKKYSNSRKGKIEWKKTLKNMPIVSDGNVIYDKLVTSVTAPSNDLIAQIYRLCLKIAQTRIGWVFGYTIFVDVNMTRSVAEMRHALNNELASTFDDVKRLRFRHMQYILNSTEEKDVSNFQFSQLIRNYYHVYETMVDKLLKGVSEKERRRYNPSGSWTMMGHGTKESSALEPDTVLKQLGNTYIVDAKMYRYGITGHVGDLPESSSIQKQLTYGDHAMNNIVHDDTVRNAFIIPYNKEENPLRDDEYESLADENLLYVGYAEGDWREKKSAHDKVYTYLIDFNYLLNNYNTSGNDMTLSLCRDIESRLENNIEAVGTSESDVLADFEFDLEDDRIEEVEDESKQSIFDLIDDYGFDYEDNRPNGNLWVFDPDEDEEFRLRAEELGYVFRYKSKRKNNKPSGWWTIDYQKNEND